MSPLPCNLDNGTLLTFGIATCLLGVLLLVDCRLHKHWYAPLVFAALLTPWILCRLLLRLDGQLWHLPVLAVMSAILIAARLSVGRGWLGRITRTCAHPVFLGAALMACGIGLFAIASVESEPPTDDIDDILRDIDGESTRYFQPVDGLNATTDAGTSIPILRITNARAEMLARADRRLADGIVHRESLIRVADSSAHTNCHGFVFTGGLCWVASDSVETILKENKYEPIDWPSVNDIVIYRDYAGKIVHTGLVRSIWSEGRILIESKWGSLGTFLHCVEHSVYGKKWNFYRSQRTSHVLLGLPGFSPRTREMEIGQ